MLGLILFFQVLIIFFIMICFIVLKQQHKDLNINITATRRFIRNVKTDMTIDEVKEDIKMNSSTYVLVEYPESQKYMNKQAFNNIEIHPAVNIDGAIFIPLNQYIKYK